MFSISIKENLLTFSKSDGTKLFDEQTKSPDDTFDVIGIFGIIEFNEKKYLVVATEAQEVGSIDNKLVYEITKGKAIPIQENSNDKNSIAIKEAIEDFLTYPGLYFSEYQLYNPYTLNQIGTEKQNRSEEQKIKNETEAENQSEMPNKNQNKNQNNEQIRSEQLENELNEFIKEDQIPDSPTINLDKLKSKVPSEFLFNQKPISSFLTHFAFMNFENMCILKCIQGYFHSYEDFILMSRRCPKRIGARYFSRGIGKQGFPSNFVETEQIISGKSSYLQIRGSIPLQWYHDVDLQFHPEIKILPFKTEQLISHTILEQIYKIPVIYFNLIKSKGYESKIFEKFNEIIKPNQELFYNFDFKKEIHKNVFPFDFTRTGFTTASSKQKEIVRTNCIDCLDRTNSMQYLIGKTLFELQLKDSGIEDIKEYQKAFQKAFYENGNNLSLQYAGTNAMSSYYITDGGESIQGLTKDVFYALYRYFVNRFRHGRYHTIINIMTGNLDKGEVNFNSKSISLERLSSLRFLIILPLFLFLYKKSGNFYFKFLFSIIFSLYVLTLVLRIDSPTYSLDELFEY